MNGAVPEPSAVASAASRWRIGSIGLLGFASGLPLALSGSDLQAWFTVAGLNLKTIGWVTLIGQAYVFKFLWAPLLDRMPLPFLGRRRGWIALMQLLCGAALVCMSFYTPQTGATVLAAFGVLLAFASATQDIAYDAHRTDLLLPAERGWGTAFFSGGYRLAMLVSGSIALILADSIGWSWVYRLMGALMIMTIAVTVVSPDAPDECPARSFAEAVTQPFADFFRRFGWLALPGSRLWCCTSCAMHLRCRYRPHSCCACRSFRRPRSASSARRSALWQACSALWPAVGVVTRMRLFPALLVLGIAQALVNLGYIWLVYSGPDVVAMATVVSAEYFFSGLGSTAFVVLVTALCNVRFSATQYALLSSLSAVGRVFLGPIAAWLVPHVGWAEFFVITALSSIPGCCL